MLKWKDEYLVGVDKIDEQHKKLFEIAGKAYDLLKNDFYTDKYGKILEILEELKQYTIFHFKSEEEYMLSIGYKRFLSQKVEHDEFINKISNIDLKNIDVDQDKYILSILEFIVNWIGDHIIQKDKLITEE